MLVSRYIVYFYIYSFMGWVYETIAMTIWTKKWDNRGFLFEPILPIYGIGAVGITGIVEYCSVNDIVWTWKHLFVVAFFGSIILEYFTGWFLEKVFHAYWWTYSNVPFNIKGRVCLPASIGFGIAGLVIVYYIYPFTRNITCGFEPLTIEVMSLIITGIVASDTALTVSVLINFEDKMVKLDNTINKNMTYIIESMKEKVHLGSHNKDLNEDDKNVLDATIKLMNNNQRSVIRRIGGFRRKEYLKRFEYVLRSIKDRKEKYEIENDI